MPYAPREHFHDVVTIADPENRLIPLNNIQVSVYNVDANGTQTTLATIYGSRTGGSIANQFITGANGSVSFWAPPGDYNIVFHDTQTPTRISDTTYGWSSVSGKAEGILSSQLPLSVQQAFLSGEIRMWPVATSPSGWALCDGSTYDGTVGGNYAALYDAIGTTFGGTGRASFKVPDMRGRYPVGKGTHIDVDTIGKSDALSIGSRTPNHSHGLTIANDSPLTNSAGAHTHTVASHSHTVTSHTHSCDTEPDHAHSIGTASRGTSSSPNSGGLESTAYTNHVHTIGAAGGHSHTIGSASPGTSSSSPATDSQGAHTHTVAAHNHGGSSIGNSSAPFFVVNYIIKL